MKALKRRRPVVGSSDDEGRSAGEGSDAVRGTERPRRCAAGLVGAAAQAALRAGSGGETDEGEGKSGSTEQALAEESPAQHALDAVAQLTALVQVLRCMPPRAMHPASQDVRYPRVGQTAPG